MKRLYMGSCWGKETTDLLSMRVLNDYNPEVIFFAGDFPYTEDNITNRWGYTTLDVAASLANNTDVAVYRDHHSQIRNSPYNKHIIATAQQFWYMWDDHETPQDDGANDLDFYKGVVGDGADKNGGATWSGTAIQADLDAAWSAARTAAVENMTGNPANTDAGIDSDAEYFSYVMGSVTYIVTDCMQYRSPYTSTDNTAKVMLGATQEAWLIDKANNATTSFVCIFMKPVYKAGGNRDTFFAYQTERDRIFTAITKTGVIVLSGDQHVPCVSYGTLGGKVMANVIGCPTAKTINNPTGSVDANNIWRWGGATKSVSDPDQTQAALMVEDPENDEWIKIRLLSPIHGVDHWQGYIQAGSNELVYSV